MLDRLERLYQNPSRASRMLAVPTIMNGMEWRGGGGCSFSWMASVMFRSGGVIHPYEYDSRKTVYGQWYGIYVVFFRGLVEE